MYDIHFSPSPFPQVLESPYGSSSEVACSHGQLQCARELREAAEAQGIDLSKEEDRTGSVLRDPSQLGKI